MPRTVTPFSRSAMQKFCITAGKWGNIYKIHTNTSFLVSHLYFSAFFGE